MNEKRLKNAMLVTEIQTKLNNRTAECMQELLRDKDNSGSEEVEKLIESIIYNLENSSRFIQK